MAQLNAYNDYKTGTTAEEQSKLVETGRVVFSGKTTDNGDYQTKSVALSELMSTSSGGGGGMSMATATPSYSTDGEYRIITVTVENNTYTRVTVDTRDIYIDVGGPSGNILHIIVNANATTDFINAVVEIEQYEDETDEDHYGVQSFRYKVFDSEFDFTQEEYASSNEGHMLKAIYPGGTAGEIEEYEYTTDLHVDSVDGQWSQFHILGRCYRVYDCKVNKSDIS